ncbi:MAG: hypothetical protein ABW170_04365 [Candidatus Thiodiazotropha sp. L084R]
MDFINQINDSDHWPGFDSPEHLSDLNEIADESFNKHTVEGYLAALLIYHQLCEEMAKLLIEDSRFFIKASIYPSEIDFSPSNKTMFGRTIEQLKETVDFNERDLFIQKCQNFNQVRNSLAHGLTKQTSIDDIKMKLEMIKKIFDEIFELFDSAHDWFYLCFKDFRKDKFIDYPYE